MPIYGRICKTLSFLTHNLAKYQYFGIKQILYHMHFIAENFIKYLFKDKNSQNKDKIAIISDCKFFIVSVTKNTTTPTFFEFLCSNFENSSKVLFLCYLLKVFFDLKICILYIFYILYFCICMYY